MKVVCICVRKLLDNFRDSYYQDDGYIYTYAIDCPTVQSWAAIYTRSKLYQITNKHGRE